MGWKGLARSFGGRSGVARFRRDLDAADRKMRTFWLQLSGRPVRLTISEDTDAALLAATEASEQPACEASGAMQLRGLARVDGKLVALHDLEPVPDRTGRAAVGPSLGLPLPQPLPVATERGAG